MSVHHDFKKASKALVRLVEWIGLAEHLAQEGKTVDAYEMLRGGCALCVLRQCRKVVRKSTIELGCVAPKRFRAASGGKRRTFDSAHELAAYLVRFLCRLVKDHPLPPRGEQKRLEMARLALSRCKDLFALNTRARLRGPLLRERERLLLLHGIRPEALKPPKGRGGRPPKYKPAIRDWANELLAADPELTHGEARNRCRSQFPGDILPPAGKRFSNWLKGGRNKSR